MDNSSRNAPGLRLARTRDFFYLSFPMDPMDQFDTQQVCEMGHKITGSLEDFPGDGRDFCSRCGSRTINRCKRCGTKIPGRNRAEDHLFGQEATEAQVAPPEFCDSCGSAFPWSVEIQTMSVKDDVRTVLDRFDAVARQLRQRHGGRGTLEINDEYDAQDLLHALLLIFFEDVRPEECTPSYAGGSARMDFLIKQAQTVIEVKKMRDSLTAKALGDELIVDIGRYRSHLDCKRLVCFVYDPKGQLQNPRGMEADLTRMHDKLEVLVMVRPH